MVNPTRQFSVLLADDDPFIVALYRDRLLRLGRQVDAVQNGEDAIRRIQESPPDLLVLDLNMPRMDGTHVLKFIREQSKTPDLPVIVLSNACSQGVIDNVNQLRPTRFLIKFDVTPKDVLAEIQALLSEIESGNAIKPVPVKTKSANLSPPQIESEGPLLVQRFEEAVDIDTKREELLLLYRLLQADLRTLKGANLLAMPFQFGEALEQLFESAYAQPEALSLSTFETFRRMLAKLPTWVARAPEGAVTPEILLIHSADDALRCRIRELCTRPGFLPLQTARAASAEALLVENNLTRIIWHARRGSAVRKLMRLLKSVDHFQRIRTLLLVPDDEWPACQNQWSDNAFTVQSLPLQEAELLVNLYSLMA